MLQQLEPFCYELAVAHQRELREAISGAAPSRAVARRRRGAGPSALRATLSRVMAPMAGRWPLLTCGCGVRSSNRAAA